MKKINSSTKSDPLLAWLDWTLRLLGAFFGITILLVFFSGVFRLGDAGNPNLFVWVSIGYLACCIIAGLTFEPTISLCGLWRSIADLEYGLQMPFLLGEGLLSPVIVIVDTLVLAVLIMLAIVGALLFLVILVLELGDFNAVTFEIIEQSSENYSGLITALRQESEKVLGPSYLGVYPRCESPAIDKLLIEVYCCSTKSATNKLKMFIVGKGYQVTGVRKYYIPSSTFLEEWG